MASLRARRHIEQQFCDVHPKPHGALTYLREGLRQIAGSTEPGPPGLPESGTVRYRGTTYGVTSFIAQTPAKPTRVPMRVYELVLL